MRMSGHTQSGSDLKIPPAASGSLCAADRARQDARKIQWRTRQSHVCAKVGIRPILTSAARRDGAADRDVGNKSSPRRFARAMTTSKMNALSGSLIGPNGTVLSTRADSFGTHEGWLLYFLARDGKWRLRAWAPGKWDDAQPLNEAPAHDFSSPDISIGAADEDATAPACPGQWSTQHAQAMLDWAFARFGERMSGTSRGARG